MSENNFLWWPKIFQQLLSKISSSKSTNSSQQSPFSVNPVEMWRRTKRTVAHRWFWEAITTKASLSPYFRSVPALLVMLEFQGWSRDGSPSPWLATSLWSSSFTLSLLSLSLHCFSSLRRLYVPIRIPTHKIVFAAIFVSVIFLLYIRIFSLTDSNVWLLHECLLPSLCFWKPVEPQTSLGRLSVSGTVASPVGKLKLTFTNLKARCLSPSVSLCDQLAAVAAPIVT